MTIHDTHPFADPEGAREPGRRLRGRLTGTVSLWTAGGALAGGERAGLTVSSWLVVAGEETRVVAMLDPDSDLLDALERTGRAVVALLTWEQRALADVFAGQAPAPGGMFAQAAFVDTDHGPRLASATTWADVRLESTATVGWSTQVTCVAEHVEIGGEDGEDDPDDEGRRAPLEHRRGRYRRPGAASR
ncbi:flavin reductase family protein [Nocardioides sp. CFH 31398]|uniref:flavin reductase family protein n=1 Tax=Nocardioides sp. CFH 31398 TaxID=2919579 RepID=UPI001F06C60F|nr:flavin reductase family protein [Nocardioides sp. CFH 31398]MCH1868237.1 flavin reductase family protein [Nocardioides sp. CFH 31398]